MARVLVIGDLHIPAVRKGYLNFCQDTAKKHKCNRVVFVGDIADWHAISFWVKQPECPGSKDEYKLALTEIQKWYGVFPRAYVCKGNHDERPIRLAKTVNIPEFMLLPYSKLWNTPKWKWDYRHDIDGVQYRHGNLCGGIHPAWNLMHKVHQSIVIGHTHSRAGIKWTCNSDMRMFAMDVGCGIDERAYQFAYGKDLVERPFISCGIVIDGIPQLIPMKINKDECYHDSRF